MNIAELNKFTVKDELFCCKSLASTKLGACLVLQQEEFV
jgi:hypothetical protein